MNIDLIILIVANTNLLLLNHFFYYFKYTTFLLFFSLSLLKQIIIHKEIKLCMVKFMSRDINYLLNKYQTKQPGEKWDSTTENEYVKNYRNIQRIYLFDKINNNFLKGAEKDRIEWLIKHFDFNSLGRINEEEIIRMLMLYVKIEPGKKHINHYEYYLEKYGIPKNRFITFLVKMARYYANNTYL